MLRPYIVTSNIEGLEAVSYFLQTRMDDNPHNEFILMLIEWTLNNNVFVFQDKLFRQKHGKAMGASFAPNYACLFLGLWEEQLNFWSFHSPLGQDYLIWKVY